MSSQKPSFSIIIPTLNEESHIGELLSDISHQSYKDFEVIIVDGQSEDQTLKVIHKYSATLPKLTLHTATKRHVSYQRNFGAKYAKSDWLLFMDADNRLPSYFLQGAKYKIEFLDPTILSFYSQPDSLNQKDMLITKLSNLYIDLQKNTSNPYCLEACLAIKKTFFLSLNGFDENLPWGEGNDFLRKAVKKRVYLKFTKDPKFTYSLRRLRKEGTLKITRNLAENELSRILGFNIPLERAKKLYPMLGGTYFTQHKNPRSTIERILSELTKIKSLPQETKKLVRAKAQLPSSLRSLINFIDSSTKNE